MKNTSTVDNLIENLTKRGLKCETHENQKNFILPGSDRMLNTKYVTASFDSVYYIAYDSYGTKAYTSKTYTGLYSIINLPKTAECNIYRKDWTDHFFRINKHKTGIKFIDDNLTITSRSGWTPRDIISDSDVSTYLKIAKNFTPVKLIIQNDYISILQNLNDKKVIGIETDTWLYNDIDLDIFLNLGVQLIKNLTNACT
jgi:hypothetical protein